MGILMTYYTLFAIVFGMTASLLWTPDLQSLAYNSTIYVIFSPWENSWNLLNTANLTVVSLVSERIIFASQSSICWQCPLVDVVKVPKFSNKTVVVDSQFMQIIQLLNSTNDPICSLDFHFIEAGVYTLTVESNSEWDESININPAFNPIDRHHSLSSANCTIVRLNNPSDPNIPVYVALVAILIAFITFHLSIKLYRLPAIQQLLGRITSCSGTSSLSEQEENVPILADRSSPQLSTEHLPSGSNVATGDTSVNYSPTTDSVTTTQATGGDREKKKQRIEAVDTFRGLCLAVMIFVNYGGGEYWYMKHSAWDGLTIADLVFPWFVFIMGTSVVLASAKQQLMISCQLKPCLILLWQLFKRSFILYKLGVITGNHPSGHRDLVDVSELRVLGVLQRLALTYFITATIVHYTTPSCRSNNTQTLNDATGLLRKVSRRVKSLLSDILPYWLGWTICLSLVLLHVCLTFLLPVPGCSRGYLGPGGLSEGGLYANCTGGAAGYIDRLLLTPQHMYRAGTYRHIYKTDMAYDPEGLLGVLTSVLICMLGVQAGRTLLLFRKQRIQFFTRYIVWAILLGLIGGILCGFRQFGGTIPVNKNLWSLSFAFVLSCFAFLLLALLYTIVDVGHWWTGAPFTYLGKNSILIYVCHEVFRSYFPVQFQVPYTHTSLLALHIWGVIVWTLVAGCLYYKRIFMSV